MEEVFREISDKALNIKEMGNVRAIVAFGSSTRPEDFVIGSSDIDILILTEEGIKKLKIREAHVKEVKSLFEYGGT